MATCPAARQGEVDVRVHGHPTVGVGEHGILGLGRQRHGEDGRLTRSQSPHVRDFLAAWTAQSRGPATPPEGLSERAVRLE